MILQSISWEMGENPFQSSCVECIDISEFLLWHHIAFLPVWYCFLSLWPLSFFLAFAPCDLSLQVERFSMKTILNIILKIVKSVKIRSMTNKVMTSINHTWNSLSVLVMSYLYFILQKVKLVWNKRSHSF